MPLNYYAWYKSRGICPKCKVENAAPGKVFCAACLLRKKEEWQSYKGEYNSQRCRERRDRLKALGMCIKCGKRPAAENRVQCDICAQQIREERRAQRMRARIARENGGTT